MGSFNFKSRALAKKTLDAIDSFYFTDSGKAYRYYLSKVLPHMADAYSQNQKPFRKHLGASLIGDTCNRKLWYSFRWFKRPDFSPRLLQLFNRGHLEEARFIALLLMIGCEVFQQDEKGRQFNISESGGHFGGSGDGIALGVPDIPEGQSCLLEFKTHNDKSFKKMVKEGVSLAKPQHAIQMNVLMFKMGIQYALYMAVNKNDDALYGEILELDSNLAVLHLKRADNVIYAEKPPEKLREHGSFFECKYCDFSQICHNNAIAETNCRTCRFSKPVDGKQWVCHKHNKILTEDMQYEGCDHHLHI